MIRKYDLEERTRKFGENTIAFCKTVPRTAITLPLISQLVRSSTSVGANYCEADNAESRLDFKHKLGICKKESKETIHWLLMIKHASPDLASDAEKIIQEAKELNLIFNAIIHTANKNDKQL